MITKLINNTYEILFGSHEFHCLMLGLWDVDLNTICYQIIHHEANNIIPTLSTPIFHYKSLMIIYFTIDRQRRSYNLIRHYYKGSLGLIFVINSSNEDSIDRSVIEIYKLLKEEDALRDSIFLILANKQDLPNAMKPEEISKRYELEKNTNRELKVFGTSDITGEGLFEALDWLEESITKKFIDI